MSRRCRVIDAGVKCGEPPVYTILFEDCEICSHHGVLFCIGHGICIQHGAGLRAGKYRTGFNDGEDADLDVERISATYLRQAS